MTLGVWAQHVPHKWYHSRLEIFYILVPQPRAFQPRHPSCEVKQHNIFAYWCEIYCQAAQKLFEFPSCWKYLEVKNICWVQWPGACPPTTWPHWLLPAYQPQQTAVMTASDVTAQPASLCLPQLIMQTIPAIRLTMFNIQYNMIYCTYNVGCRIYCSERRQQKRTESQIMLLFFSSYFVVFKMGGKIWAGGSDI